MHSVDPPLHCNFLTCRRAISGLANDHAVVTTCSHVFCEQCATTHFSAALVCPACEAPLPEPEDIALMTLNPSERYKSSVLSGLPPSIIHDIAGRALNFWVYQMAQQCAFLEMTNNQVEARVQASESRINAVTAQSNQELTALRDQLRALEHDRELDHRRIYDLSEQCAEKSRELARLQVQMDHLRRKSIVPRAADGGGSGEFVANGDLYQQQAPADAGRAVMAGGQVGGGTTRLPAKVQASGACGMHWTTAAAGPAHGPSARPPTAQSWRAWILAETPRDGGASNAIAGNQQHQLHLHQNQHHQDRSMRHGSVIPNPMAAAGPGGGIPTPRSGRSAFGPPVMIGGQVPGQVPPPAHPMAHGHRTGAVEWMQQQVPQQQQHAPMLQQQQHQQHRQGGHGQGQRRSSRAGGGRSKASR